MYQSCYIAESIQRSFVIFFPIGALGFVAAQDQPVSSRMLFGVVLGLSSFFKSREGGAAIIDGFPFRLFYSFTCGILFLSTALVGLQDLVGGVFAFKIKTDIFTFLPIPAKIG